MPKRSFRIREGQPLLDIVSYGRGRSRGSNDRLTPEQVEHIRLTVRRAPEVMVKVLPRASNDLKAVGKHIDYIGRKGALELETDDGARLGGRIGNDILNDWDLDIDDVRRQSSLKATGGNRPPKLVHKLMFSMPPGTPPIKVLEAVRYFAREEFWGHHRYAFVLHTDEAHPHVHLVLKAVSEEGIRLNIKKANLRHWRSEFALNLRLVGLEANATDRAVRGVSESSKKDGIYRAKLRSDSTYIQAQIETLAADSQKVKSYADSGSRTLVETRRIVEAGWHGLAKILANDGYAELARDVKLLVDQMSPPRTEQESIAVAIQERTRGRREEMFR